MPIPKWLYVSYVLVVDTRKKWRKYMAALNAWPGRFIEAVGLKLVRSKEYLVSIIGSRLSCKACGTLLPFDNIDEHFQAHMGEVDAYLATKQEEKREQNAEKRASRKEGAPLLKLASEGFYPNPCESCGEAIPRTGRPGRPPRVHDACKGVKTSQNPKQDTSPTDIEAELGLL